jgi:hypothetical protein
MEFQDPNLVHVWFLYSLVYAVVCAGVASIRGRDASRRPCRQAACHGGSPVYIVDVFVRCLLRG